MHRERAQLHNCFNVIFVFILNQENTQQKFYALLGVFVCAVCLICFDFSFLFFSFSRPLCCLFREMRSPFFGHHFNEIEWSSESDATNKNQIYMYAKRYHAKQTQNSHIRDTCTWTRAHEKHCPFLYVASVSAERERERDHIAQPNVYLNPYAHCAQAKQLQTRSRTLNRVRIWIFEQQQPQLDSVYCACINRICSQNIRLFSQFEKCECVFNIHGYKVPV